MYVVLGIGNYIIYIYNVCRARYRQLYNIYIMYVVLGIGNYRKFYSLPTNVHLYSTEKSRGVAI